MSRHSAGCEAADKVVAMFKQLDAKSEGTLPEKVITDVLMSVGMSEDHCRTLYSQPHVHKNGLIKYKELLEWIFVAFARASSCPFRSPAAESDEKLLEDRDVTKGAPGVVSLQSAKE